MKKIIGESVSPGIAMGKAFVFSHTIPEVKRFSVHDSQKAEELERYYRAIKKVKFSLIVLKNRLKVKKTASSIGLQLLDTHLTMLNDPFFHKQVPKAIRNSNFNAEWILQEETAKMSAMFAQIEDEYLKAREADFKEMSFKIINALLDIVESDLRNLPKGAILIAHDLQLSDLLKIDYENLHGIALDMGGQTTHTSILISASNIPLLIGCIDATQVIPDGQTVVLDSYHSLLAYNLDSDEMKKYMEQRDDHLSYQQRLKAETKGETFTRDNQRIFVKANVESADDIKRFAIDDIDGIGLFRSEFLFLNRSDIPSEEEQFQIYTKVISHLKTKPVIIRTIDLGGEKKGTALTRGLEEDNPLLGMRGIRLAMNRKESFEKQIRALFRASAFGNLSILIPFVSSTQEFDEVLTFIEEVKAGLKRDNLQFNEAVPIGVMIETPAAAIAIDRFIKKADFFAIGTNDLTQYTLAVERGNQTVDYLFNPYHISLLRLIKNVIAEGKKANKDVHICGELAGYPLATVLLLGLGLKNFSMNAANMTLIKKIIRSVDLEQAEKLATNILEHDKSSEIPALLTKWMSENLEYIKY